MATKVAGNMYESITGQLFEIGRQLRQEKYPYSPTDLQKHLQMAIEGRFAIASVDSNLLARLYEDEEIWVEATDGTRMIADEKKLFSGYRDSHFRKWGTRKPSGIETPRMQAEVYEMHNKDARFVDMIPAKRLWQSQDQVLDFVERHRDRLHPKEWTTFFPYKDGDHMFVAVVLEDAGKLKALVYRLEYDYVWDAERRSRVVLPQLET